MNHSTRIKYISLTVGFVLVLLVFGFTIKLQDTIESNSPEGNGDLTELSAERPPTEREPLTWPFSQNSIWNMPIGSQAEYVDAKIDWVKHATADVDYFFVLDANDPLRPVFAPGNWGAGRSAGSEYRNIALPLADDLIIPDATDKNTPNNAAALLMPDGRTLVQLNPITRDRKGSFVYGYRSANEDIYGPGIQGGHGGSGLSSIGGSIRLGELLGAEPIRHALKINLFAEKFISFSQGPGGGLGFRWPATRADGYADSTTYDGAVPQLTMGALLAIPPHITPQSLDIQTEAGIKLFHAFQDYGAYVADNTNWDAHAIEVENGVLDEFESHYGYQFQGTSGSFYDDYMKLFSALNVVDNNGPNSIGGGGNPRGPLAPPFASTDRLPGPGQTGRNPHLGNTDLDTTSSDDKDGIMQGGDGHNFLTGGDGDNSISGGAGNDHLFGEEGNDILRGDDGNDYLDGGEGNDAISGDEGDDFLSGWDGDDVLNGGAGMDTVVESINANFILTDSHLQGRGFDTLVSIEHVILSGGEGDNTLDASAFNAGTVHLHGGPGDDVLDGGSHNDILVSSSGKDILTGHAGGDTFQLTSRVRFILSSRSNSHESGDFALIADFDTAEDVVELEENASRYLLENSPIDGTSGTAIYIDVDGNGAVDAEDELLVVVEGTNELSLDEQYFHYIPVL